jgi:Tetratricopeptide repeat/NB-ARC domain
MPASASFSIWNVPYRRNPFFTGHEDILQSLYTALTVDKTAALVDAQALTGLAGIGKTQAAVEYAYRYASDYPEAILWARADSREVLTADFASIAELLDLPEKMEQDLTLVLAAVKRWMKDRTHWLLILDNVEKPALIDEFLPTAHRGHILLTTRAQSVRFLANNIRVEKWSPDVGALFLLRRTKMIALRDELDHAAPTDRDTAKEISQELDGLPLALEQAGAYIETSSCDLSTYLALYRRRRSILLKRGSSFGESHPQSVVTTFSLSFQNVQKVNRAAIELLRCCAFLYPEAIPEMIITDGSAYCGSTLRRTAVDPLKLNEALRELLRYSLVQRDADSHTLTIHHLVQAVLKDKMDSLKRLQWAERVVRAVSHVFPEVEVATWPFCQQCLPHALECAAHIKEWDMSFPEAAHLLNQAGYYLEDRAQYVEARPLYQSALEMRERILGPDHPDTALSTGYHKCAPSLCSSLSTVYVQLMGLAAWLE